MKTDGEQHFLYTKKGRHTKEKLAKVQERDEIKNEYCRSHSIPLIRIPYTHLESICLEDLRLETTKFRVI